jgi:hypothetical protein
LGLLTILHAGETPLLALQIAERAVINCNEHRDIVV